MPAQSPASPASTHRVRAAVDRDALAAGVEPDGAPKWDHMFNDLPPVKFADTIERRPVGKVIPLVETK